MSSPIQIRPMMENDIDMIYRGLSGHEISKPLDYVMRCWSENESKERVTLLAIYDSEFVGWGHVAIISHYPHFSDNGIPEIQNFDVIPPYRKHGIGNKLIDNLEKIAFTYSDTIGIGFGLYSNYGAAQRLYIKRGFIPDGKGLMYDNRSVEPGSRVRVDDDLVLFLTKSKNN